MDLQEHSQTAFTLKAGQESGIPVAPGQMLKVEVSPGGPEILAAPCPAGKNWSARVIVEITET